MILILEQDVRPQADIWFWWRPRLFKGSWKDRKTWRVGWGFWTISYYPEPGLNDFFNHIDSGATSWQK